MKIVNFLQLNDWKINRFLAVIFSFQISIYGLQILDHIGIQIPIIQQLVGFIYLAFIPGILILRCLKIHQIGSVKTLLYSVGLSITAIMLTGFVINIIAPIINLNDPISTNSLLIIISLIIVSLSVLSYFLDKNFSDTSYINIQTDFFSPYILFLCLIPFLSIFGTYAMNFYGQNILQLLLIPTICIIVYITLFRKIKPEFYPFSIFIISLSILLHASLVSTNLWGYDINIEHYFAESVIKNSFWNLTIYSDINAMFSIVILAPTLSLISNLNITWVFKIIYPFLFSLVPVGLYNIFNDQIKNEKISFLACFFFISFITFGVEMLQLARQEIAELFLVLLILIIFEKDIFKMKKSFLMILFGFSLIVSHYGLSYIFGIYLLGVLVIMPLIKNQKIIDINKNNLNNKIHLNNTFIILFLVVSLFWFIYISGGFIIDKIAHIGNQIYGSIFTDFLNPNNVQGLNMATAATNTPLRFIFKIMNYITQFFILLGVTSLLFLKNKEMEFYTQYKIFALISLLFLILSVTIPDFSNQLNTTRIFQITSIFLAPFYVFGGILLLKSVSRVKLNFKNETILKILTIFTIVYFLFSSGFIYEIANDQPSSILLNNKLDGPVFLNSEISGAYWLTNYENGTIYTDNIRFVIFSRYSLTRTNSFSSGNFNLIPNNSYIYLGRWNIVNNEINVGQGNGSSLIYDNSTLNHFNKIYSSGGSTIYSK